MLQWFSSILFVTHAICSENLVADITCEGFRVTHFQSPKSGRLRSMYRSSSRESMALSSTGHLCDLGTSCSRPWGPWFTLLLILAPCPPKPPAPSRLRQPVCFRAGPRRAHRRVPCSVGCRAFSWVPSLANQQAFWAKVNTWLWLHMLAVWSNLIIYYS